MSCRKVCLDNNTLDLDTNNYDNEIKICLNKMKYKHFFHLNGEPYLDHFQHCRYPIVVVEHTHMDYNMVIYFLNIYQIALIGQCNPK